jgi:hypothetical protein
MSAYTLKIPRIGDCNYRGSTVVLYKLNRSSRNRQVISRQENRGRDMRKEYFIVMAVVLLAAIGVAGGMASTVYQAPAGHAGTTIKSFVVTRPAIRPGERTTVRVLAGNDTDNAVTFAWQADAGTLSATRANPVTWTAPQTEGTYLVGVEVTDAKGQKSRGSTGILVSRNPADPLIMCVNPMGCRQRSTGPTAWSSNTSSFGR